MEAVDVLETLEIVASDQWGVISSQQAGREGVSRLHLSRLAGRGILERVRRGVYCLPSVQYDSRMEIRAAWISLEPKLFIHERWGSDNLFPVSYESAASIHNIGDLIPHKHSFSAPARKQTRQADIRIYTNRDFDQSDIVDMDGLPVTSVARTIGDLAEQKIERNYLATLVAEGLKKEGVRFRSLAGKLAPSAEFYGASSGEQLLDDLHDEAASVESKQEAVDRFFSTAVTPQGRGLVAESLLSSVYPVRHRNARADLAEKIRQFFGAQSVVDRGAGVLPPELSKGLSERWAEWYPAEKMLAALSQNLPRSFVDSMNQSAGRGFAVGRADDSDDDGSKDDSDDVDDNRRRDTSGSKRGRNEEEENGRRAERETREGLE